MNGTIHKIIQNFLKYLGERNLEELVNLFSETVDWYIPGDEEKAPWLGKRNTSEEIRCFYELLWKNTEPVSATIDNIFTDHENAIITGVFSTKMLYTNQKVDSMFCIQMHILNDKIIKYRLLEDSYAISKSLTK